MTPSPFRLTLAFALTLAWFPPAFAQVDYSPEHAEYEFSGFLGGSFAPDFHFATPVVVSGVDETSRTVGMRYASGYQIGARVTQNFRDFWSADLAYSFANQPLRFTNLSPQIQSLSLSHYIHHFSYNVSYLPLPPTKRFRPYASIGAGAVLFFLPGSSKEDATARGVNLRDDWEFTGNWGGGFRYLVREQFAINFDVKDQMSHVPDYGLPRTAYITDTGYHPGLATSGIFHNWQLHIGLSFQWDE